MESPGTSEDGQESVRTKPSGPFRPNVAPVPSPPGFEILEELGRGGMGVVYRARQTKLNRIVALKMIRGEGPIDDAALQRFQIENRAVARMQHTNIVQVFEVGEWDGTPFCALEFCAAGSLADAIKKGPLPARVSAVICEKLARAMAHAHNHSVVHRDLKPANILMAGEPTAALEACEPKIGDFGLAKQLDEDDLQTRTGAILGTPCFMAPEQAEGRTRESGPAADLWALGGILYACMTGQPPFRGKNSVETLERVLNEDPIPPRTLDRGVPLDLETICLKCLRKEPQKRYGSAGELAEDLSRFLNFEPILARPMGRRERVVRWVRRHPTTMIGSLTVLVALIGSSIGYGLWKQREHAREHARKLHESNEEKLEYFAGLVRRNGEPEGTIPISEEAATRRLSTYRFVRKGGVLQRIDIVNSYVPNEIAYLLNPSRWVLSLDVRLDMNYLESPRTWSSRERSLHLLRDEHGALIGEEMRDAYGQLQWGLTWIDRDRVCRVSEETEQGKTRVRETRYFRFSWNDDGFIGEIWETDADGKRASRPGRWSGARLEYDLAGGLRKLTSLDENGANSAIVGGAAGVTIDRDERDRISRIGLVGADGRAKTIPLSPVSQVKIRYDAEGGMELALFDPEDRPASLLFTFHKYVLKFRNDGREIDRYYFGPTGSLFSGVRDRFDDLGNNVESTFIDENGRPFLPSNQKFVREANRYDERGALLELQQFRLKPNGEFLLTGSHNFQNRTRDVWHFDGEGKPSYSPQGGYHRSSIRENDQKRVLETASFDVDGRPMLNSLGRHRTTKAYNEAGNVIEEAYFGIDGKPIRNKNGTVKVTARYGETGEKVEETYWTLTSEGVLAARLRRDGQGKRLEECIFDSTGRPSLSSNGWHRITDQYDSSGRLIEQRLFGPDGKPTRDKFGDFKITLRYDTTGKRQETTWWTTTPDGEPAVRLRRDGQDKLLEEGSFDSKGTPILNATGWHRIRHKYDAAGNTIEGAYFDTNDRPMPGPLGQHRWTKRYGSKGQTLEQLAYDAEGRLDRGKQGEARVTWEYDSAGALKVIEYWTLTPDEKFALLSRTDPRGKLLEKSLFEDGRPVRHSSEGWHRVRLRNDEVGNAVEAAFFGLDDKPVSHRGYHRWTAKYDDRSRMVEQYCFDVAGKACICTEGYHIAKWDYSDPKNVRRTYFDLVGKSVEPLKK